MKKTTCRLAALLLTAVMTCSLAACAKNDPANPHTYDFGKDKVASISSVVGDREVIGRGYQDENEFPSFTYTYSSTTVTEDLQTYVQSLKDNGWTPSGPGFDLTTFPGTVQMVKESKEQNKILVLVIAYEEDAYTLKVTQAVAALAQ